MTARRIVCSQEQPILNGTERKCVTASLHTLCVHSTGKRILAGVTELSASVAILSTMTASEIKSSVPLQICLYFHDYYVYLSFLVTIVLYIVKSECLEADCDRPAACTCSCRHEATLPRRHPRAGDLVRSCVPSSRKSQNENIQSRKQNRASGAVRRWPAAGHPLGHCAHILHSATDLRVSPRSQSIHTPAVHTL